MCMCFVCVCMCLHMVECTLCVCVSVCLCFVFTNIQIFTDYKYLQIYRYTNIYLLNTLFSMLYIQIHSSFSSFSLIYQTHQLAKFFVLPSLFLLTFLEAELLYNSVLSFSHSLTNYSLTHSLTHSLPPSLYLSIDICQQSHNFL